MRAKALDVLPENASEVARLRLKDEPGISREQRRSRRRRAVRGTTINVKRMAKRDLEIGRLLNPVDPFAPPRPRTRAECEGGQRPCPYVSCKWHLFLDVSPKTGAIKLNFPDIEPDEMVNSCVLDVADRGGETLERCAEITNLTRERIRQIEVSSRGKLVRHLPLLSDAIPERPTGNVYPAAPVFDDAPPSASPDWGTDG